MSGSYYSTESSSARTTTSSTTLCSADHQARTHQRATVNNGEDKNIPETKKKEHQQQVANNNVYEQQSSPSLTMEHNQSCLMSSPSAISSSFLPLQRQEIEHCSRDENNDSNAPPSKGRQRRRKRGRRAAVKRTIIILLCLALLFLIIDTLSSPPEKRVLFMEHPEVLARKFFQWIQTHPIIGLCAYVLVYAVTIVVMLPATPLTLGGGYVFKTLYGWVGGITVGTTAAMSGSVVGASICFLLGRYVMRTKVRTWIVRYPLFDALDLAISVNGFRITAMLCLTPVLPIGPVSYMCGTTSMRLVSFALARIVSFPLMILYVFIGASTGAMMDTEKEDDVKNDGVVEDKQNTWIATILGNENSMMVLGIVLSIVSIACISHYVKKELNKVSTLPTTTACVEKSRSYSILNRMPSSSQHCRNVITSES